MKELFACNCKVHKCEVISYYRGKGGMIFGDTDLKMKRRVGQGTAENLVPLKPQFT